VSRRILAYPTGWTLAVLDADAEVDEAARELTSIGIGGDDLVILGGPDAAERLDQLGTSSGVASRLRRGVQFLAMDQMPDLHVYELAIAQGRLVLAMRVDGALGRPAVSALVRHGAHFVNRFGSWVTEEIVPWRGTKPSLPHHMQR
jgi:hypothetical protein